jgi:hypothetical protein
MREPKRECHGRRVNGGHLGREHGLHLIRRFYTFDQGEHEVKSSLIDCSPLRSSIGELPEKPV